VYELYAYESFHQNNVFFESRFARAAAPSREKARICRRILLGATRLRKTAL